MGPTGSSDWSLLVAKVAGLMSNRLKKKSFEKYTHSSGGVQFSIRQVAIMKACTDQMKIPQE